MADSVAGVVGIDLLHIADPTAQAIVAERFGLDVLVPAAADRAVVHDIIYRELVAGVVRDESRDAYRGVIARLVARGAQAMILGCTEIMLLVGADESAVPLFDTTRLHALAAVDRALA